MAVYHCEVSVIGRAAGRSAIAASAYRACTRLEDPVTGEVHDYTRKSGLAATWMQTPDEAPDWATDRNALWAAVEKKENRSNSQLARHFELALPHELTPDQQQAMLREWVQAQLVDRGMAADVAIHDPRGKADRRDLDAVDAEADADTSPRNQHAHVMTSLRRFDLANPDGWTKGKERSWNDRALVETWRESWAAIQNRYLEAHGHAARVDHRSLEDQRAAAEAAGDEIAALALSRTPEPKLGVSAAAMERQGIATDRGEAVREAREARINLLALADTARAAERAVEREQARVEIAASIADFAAAVAQIPPQPEEPDMAPPDLTRRAVERHLRGLGLDAVEISVIGGDRPHVRTMTPAEIIADLPRLKRANKSGCSILVRGPRDRDHDLILLDDLPLMTPDRMRADGIAPAVVVETSPGNYQAWVKLGSPQPAEIRHEVSRALAQRYGSDPGSVDPHQSGRLAGFTNAKPEHRAIKGSPFVLLHRFAGAVAEKAADLIAAARSALSRRAEIAAITAAPTPDASLVGWWRTAQEAVPAPRDLSAIDWHLTHVALVAGRAPEDIAAAMAETADRKGKAASAYAERTVSKAVSARALEASDPFNGSSDGGPSLG